MKHLTNELYFKLVQDIAREKGGDCLSKHYINSYTKLTFQCSKGHKWDAQPSNVWNGHWCSQCANNNQRLGLEVMQSIAENKGGSCLSITYINNYTKLKFQCSKGHIWMVKPIGIRRGRWCPKCAHDSQRSDIEQLHSIVEKKGGKVISSEYINALTKLEFECAKGHRWFAIQNSIRQGKWCNICAYDNLKVGIERIRKIAQSKGGKVISTEYINTNTKLEFECANGHRWHTAPRIIQQGKWCKRCAFTILTLEDVQAIVEKRGGKVISTKYVNIDTKLEFECANKHRWFATPAGIRNNRWCPYCHSTVSKGEKECKRVLEGIFGTPFIKAFHSWLPNPATQSAMQLDGYAHENNIAFEYNGKQHYKKIDYWQTQDIFDQLLERDIAKAHICNELDITLITIPFWIELDNISDFIRQELEKEGVTV